MSSIQLIGISSVHLREAHFYRSDQTGPSNRGGTDLQTNRRGTNRYAGPLHRRWFDEKRQARWWVPPPSDAIRHCVTGSAISSPRASAESQGPAQPDPRVAISLPPGVR